MKNMIQMWNEMMNERKHLNMEKRFQVAGVTFEGRQKVLEMLNQEYHEIGIRRFVKLIPEPTNKYDSNAVKIEVDIDGNNYQIGYVPKTINNKILELLKNDKIKNVRLSDIGRVFEKNVLGGTITYEEK